MRSILAVRSFFSLLYGIHSPGAIVDMASRWNVGALAISDRENLYGVHEFLEAAKEAGIRPIISAELMLHIDDSVSSVFAFVQNRQGFSRLCTILSLLRTDSSFSLLDALKHDSDGLVIATADPGALEQLAEHVAHLYAAITPRSLGAIPCARRLRIPLAALEDALFMSDEDYEVHRVLRSIASGKTIGTLNEHDCADRRALFHSPAEMEARCSSWPEALEGTERIADECRFDTIFEHFIFPDYKGPSSKDELRKRVLEGAERRYGEVSDAVMGRIDYELDIIEKKGFAPYFLVMHDIVAMADRTCGRGSGAASIVSYCLGITNIDPIAHNLYFERFLTISRPDPPDIDVDFAWDERDALIRRVIDRFGVDHCARVANHNRFRSRCALRETAKAYGICDADITGIERNFFEQQNSQALSDPLWIRIFSMAKKIEGLPRGLSMHCGGLVITPEPIARYAPIEQSAEGFALLSWEKEGTESAGLVKIDLLGNRSLAVIRDALQNLKEDGIDIDAFTWRPHEDAPTIAALARGDSIGVFYIESPAMRQLQKKTGRGDFEHIVIHSSIIRPAANKYIFEYVERLKGKPWKALHPRLAYILNETYGILCYQEDVSKTAVALAGFSESDADKLRKVIAKKAGPEKLGRFAKQFYEGCMANGVDTHIIEEVWAMMLSFDGYSFCKPHSASYAMVSFQSAYLRVHYPAYFMAAVLANQGGYYRSQAYISEARRMGLAIEGPDINCSRIRYHAKGSSVIIGLMAIANLSRQSMTIIVEERERNGMFQDLYDVVRRVSLPRDDVVSLVAAGAFDSISQGIPRNRQVRILLTCLHKNEMAAEPSLFDLEHKLPLPRKSTGTQVVRSVPSDAELHEEFSVLGFLRRHHPLMLYKSKIATIRRIRACDIPSWEKKRVTLLGWPITQKEIWTKTGQSMNFVSFEDETELFEA
ncbi:MAG: DNA polymerase III subunit alpha, partial [Spirochaetales bacterium]|nr:DNA polymerase III subunit alpha [Spirochaetales bacterium]